jgi:putative hemolysin
MLFLRLVGVLALVLVNAFFAATEFSVVAVRHSRIRQLAQKGNARAKIVEGLIADLGRVISGVQVGITLTSLALGYVGEITLAEALSPAVSSLPTHWAFVAVHTIALVLAFAMLTVVEVVLGELVPKGITLAKPEQVAMLIARPFTWFLHSFRWAIDLLDGVADRINRAIGVRESQGHTSVHSAEELQVLVEQARERGLLQATEMQVIQGTIGLGEVQVRQIMVSRPDIHALPVEASVDETLKMFATTQRSRLPVYEGTLDHVAGFVHIKDMVWALMERSKRIGEAAPFEFHLKQYLRPILIVPDTKPVSELLVEFRTRRTELAMVVDEFGSILGLVTLENILEQVVGQIHDEFDVIERPSTLPDGSLIFDASLKIRDLESQYGIVVPEDPSYETIGGFVLSRLGFLPRGGESIESNGYRFTVVSVERRRISRVRVKEIESARPVSAGGTREDASGGAPAGGESKAGAGAASARRAPGSPG